MDNLVKSVSEMDILQTGYLHRLETNEPPRIYTLRDFGLLECPEIGLSISLTNATIVSCQSEQTILITGKNIYSMIFRPESESSFAAWGKALDTVTKGRDFRVTRDVIGVGETSTVFRGIRERDGIDVAVKAVSRKSTPTAAFMESHMSTFLSRTAIEDYPAGLVRCLATYHTKNETHSVMEAVGLDLEAWLKRQGRFSESTAKGVVVQLLSALDFLHTKDIVHGGVCAENVLVAGSAKDDLDVRLAGFSKAFIKGNAGWLPKRDHADLIKGMRGVYTAPEVLYKDTIGPGADFWGLGVLLYRALVGRLPFWRIGDTEQLAEHRMREYAKIDRSDIRRGVLFPEGDEVTAGLTADAQSFVSSLLIPRVEERMTARSMTRHPWLLLARIPVKRRSGSNSPVNVFIRGIAR